MDHHRIDIDYDGQPLHITAMAREVGEDIVYDCYTGDVLIGTVRPMIADEPYIIWVGYVIPSDVAAMIGEAIERQDW